MQGREESENECRWLPGDGGIVARALLASQRRLICPSILAAFFLFNWESVGTLLCWLIYMYANRLLMYLNLGRYSKESHNSTEMGLLKALSSSFSPG